MALTSPGVQVTVVDESFYTPAGPGTRPLIIVASATNKQNGSRSGVAPGTLAVNAGRVYTITSQRELVETFGDPVFKVDSNNTAIHAAEQNEYGLQAAYSFLGVSNSVQVVRADLDLSVLDPRAEAPAGAPQDGTFWLDTGTSRFGIFEWDGTVGQRGSQSFSNKMPLLVLDQTQIEAGIPKLSIGSIGDYAVAVGAGAAGTDNEPDADDRDSHELAIFYKTTDPVAPSEGADWVKVGSADWKRRWPSTAQGTGGAPAAGDTFIIRISVGNEVNLGSGYSSAEDVRDAINGTDSPFTAQIVSGRLFIHSEVSSFTLVGTGWPKLGLSNSVTYRAPELAIQSHTQVPLFKVREGQPRPSGSVWIKTTEPNAGAYWRLKRYNDQTKLWETSTVPHYASSQAALAALDSTGGGINIPLNAAYVQGNFEESEQPLAEFRVMRRARTGATTVRTKDFSSGISNNGSLTLVIKESLVGSAALETVTVSLPSTGAITPDILAAAIASAAPTNVTAGVEMGRVVISHRLGGEMRFGGTLVASLGLYGLLGDTGNNVNVYRSPEGDSSTDFVASNWLPLTITPDTATAIRQSYYIRSTEPNTLIENGTLWYSSIVDEVDIMVHNGTTWVGYLDPSSPYYDANAAERTDPKGPIVSASEPVAQSDGSDLKEGDLWIDTGDLENYPLIKRYDPTVRSKWVELDKSDQTSENGVLFADARAGVDGGTPDSAPAGTIEALLTSNHLDPDAPDPALYPRGMLLWNLRRSGFNVKRFARGYIDVTGENLRVDETTENYYPHRWVTESGNQEDGSGSFGRKAQRKVIVQALQATVNSNEQIRDTERNTFNLIACPGYPELIGEMINLNYDRGITAFVVGDTPARLRPDATSINEWGTNLNGSLQDDDKGLVSFDEYLGVFYPWGFTSDNLGRDVVVPPSHMILRMIALNDQVAYPWFAPAGTRRGGITNATSVGYVTPEGEFEFVALNEGQRDTLYNVKVNPITFFVASGLVNFGQKTRARNASALDRINVARLVIYLRDRLNVLAKPYIFEPNDKITRDEIKQQVETFLVELVGLRALYDFLVVCDESNNTPNRIDRNELYVDIAIEPVKAVEFIYIPVRLKNTGEIAGL